MIIKNEFYTKGKVINNDEVVVLAAIKRLQGKGDKFVNRTSITEEIAEYFDMNYVQQICSELENKGILELTIRTEGR